MLPNKQPTPLVIRRAVDTELVHWPNYWGTSTGFVLGVGAHSTSSAISALAAQEFVTGLIGLRLGTWTRSLSPKAMHVAFLLERERAASARPFAWGIQPWCLPATSEVCGRHHLLIVQLTSGLLGNMACSIPEVTKAYFFLILSSNQMLSHVFLS